MYKLQGKALPFRPIAHILSSFAPPRWLARIRFIGGLPQRKGGAFPQGKRRSRRSLLGEQIVIWTSFGSAAPPRGRPEERTNAQTDTENAEQILRRRGRFHRRGGGGKVARGASTEKKMLINDERSRNVYENKQKDDTFTDKKGDISTQRSDIFYRSTRILLKPSAFLSLF